MPLTRITITIPRDVLAAVERRAREVDRSRSRVIVDAVREYLASGATGSGRLVRESASPGYGAGLVAEARRRHLESELALTPEERLRRSDALSRLAREAPHGTHRRGPRHQVIGFDSYEDFYQWRKARLAGV
ncbi:MAG: CopG family ribbon-helix-helix protein [Gemmatimonadales bacterium]